MPHYTTSLTNYYIKVYIYKSGISFMAYTTIDLVREKTTYTTTDILDDEITQIIGEATADINQEINTRIIREPVRFIDNSRQNKLDGSNTTFYVQKSILYNFGDDNNDGELNITDIKVEIEDNEGTITEATVNTIDVEGSYTLSAAPDQTTTVRMYTTYKYTYYDITIPDKLVVLLGTYLASSYAALVVDSNLPSNTKLGNIAVTVPIANTKYRQFTDRYTNLLKKVKVPSNKPRTKTYSHMI